MPNPNNPVFPAAVATDLDLMVATNRALSKLTNPIDASQTQITVVDGTKFQVPCLVQIDTEVVRVGALSGNNLMSCTRGFALSSPASHGQNADVKGYVLSHHHNQLAAEIKAIESGAGKNFENVVMQNDFAGGADIGGLFSNLYIKNNGVTAGTFGGFNTNILVSVDATGRVTSIANSPGNINYPIMYKAAIVQGTNAVLGFSFAGTMGVDAPNAVPVDHTGDSGLLYAVAQFTQGNDYWVQDHWYLPDDWQGDKISLDVYWRAAVTTGTVTWGVRLGALRPANGPDITWNPWKYVTDNVAGTTLHTVKSRITPLFISGLVPGDELFFQFERASSGSGNPGDTAAGPADLISIKFNLNRNFALAQ